jgi:hypothetical protein
LDAARRDLDDVAVAVRSYLNGPLIPFSMNVSTGCPCEFSTIRAKQKQFDLEQEALPDSRERNGSCEFPGEAIPLGEKPNRNFALSGA